jgi:hypothetical protein
VARRQRVDGSACTIVEGAGAITGTRGDAS